MNGEGALHYSHDTEIVRPRADRAYPIPCAEWDHIKVKIKRIGNRANYFEIYGSMAVGAGLSAGASTFIAMPSASATATTIGFAVTLVMVVCGLMAMALARQSRSVDSINYGEVISHMEIIEARYKQADVIATESGQIIADATTSRKDVS